MREQVVALEDDANIGPQRAQADIRVVDLMATHFDLAAINDLQPVYAAQGGTFA